MGCASYCESGLEAHDLVTCGEYKLGGVSAIIIGACGATLVDPTSPVGIMAYLCDSGKVIYIDPPVGITTSANFIIPEQNNELQRYEVTFSWRQKEIPTQFTAPAGLFN